MHRAQNLTISQGMSPSCVLMSIHHMLSSSSSSLPSTTMFALNWYPVIGTLGSFTNHLSQSRLFCDIKWTAISENPTCIFISSLTLNEYFCSTGFLLTWTSGPLTSTTSNPIMEETHCEISSFSKNPSTSRYPFVTNLNFGVSWVGKFLGLISILILFYLDGCERIRYPFSISTLISATFTFLVIE